MTPCWKDRRVHENHEMLPQPTYPTSPVDPYKSMFQPSFFVGETKSNVTFSWLQTCFPASPPLFCWKSKDPFRDIRKKNIAFLIFYAHNPAISWAPFQKSWASLFHHLPLWMEKNKKNKSDNTLHCSLLFPKNGLLHDHQLVVGQVACQKGLALGVTDMTRKNRREIGPLTIETYWNWRLSRQKWWLDMTLLYFTGWWVLTCYNHLEKWWSSSMGRMTSLIWNGK